MKKLLLLLLTVTALYAESNDDSRKEADLFVNVTAARELKETASIPAAVTVITKEDMAGHSVTEALSIYTGIAFSSTANAETTASPMIRGFSENSQGRVLVMVDGVKLNNPDMSAVNWLSIPEDRIERIEVIKGANSALYGDNAVAAVINIITTIPENGISVMTDINGGNLSSYGGSVSVSAKNDLGYLNISAESEKTDGWRERTGFESTDFSVKAGFTPFEKLDMSLSLLYNDSEYEMPGKLTKAQYDDNSEQALNKEDFAENNFTQISSTIVFDVNDKVDAEIVATYNNKYTESNFYSIESFPWDPDPTKFSETKIDSFYITPSVGYQVSELLWGSSAMIGIDFSNENLNIKGYSDENKQNEKNDANAKRNTFGAYSRIESYLLENLVFSFSLRKEVSKYEAEFKDSSLDDDIIHSPFVYGSGLSYIFAENSKIYLSYNKLYRYPFFDEQASYYGSTYDVFIGDLDPEKGDSFEAGVEYNGFKYAKGGINLFYLLMEDEIAWGTSKNENMDKTIHYGAETNLTVAPVDIFFTRFNYNYTVAKFTEGDNKDNSLTLVPEHTFSIIPELKLFNLIKAYAEFSYNGEMFEGGDNTNSNDKMESYFLTNTGMSLSKNYDKADVKIYLDIKNLFDTEYVPLVFWSGYYPGSGREITVGSSVSF